MKAMAAGLATGLLLWGAATFGMRSQVKAAEERLLHPPTEEKRVAIADESDAPYCTPAFKTVLQRVLHACGLVGGDSRRGCQPADVKQFASISDDDFNALFNPLRMRGAVVLFDENSPDLDLAAKQVIEEKWTDRKGARYFFVLARGSKTGSVEANRTLSHKRANSVMFHLRETLNDPELDKQVGLMWLGKEFAQLGKEYCEWNHSRADKACDQEAVNRSAFVSWVDCRL